MRGRRRPSILTRSPEDQDEQKELRLQGQTASGAVCLQASYLTSLCHSILGKMEMITSPTSGILCVRVSRSVVSDSLRPHGLWPTRLLCPWDSPRRNTGVGCHSLLQGIFLTQGWNPGLLHGRQILYHLSRQDYGGDSVHRCMELWAGWALHQQSALL